MQPDPGEGPALRRGGQRGECGPRSMRHQVRGDPPTPHKAGHVKDIRLFMKETGAVDKKWYYLHFESDLGLP